MDDKVRNLMRRGAITCGENTSIRDVAQIMIVNRTRYCIVVNARHEVVGIISADSMLRAFGRDLDGTHARDILMLHSVTVTPSTPLDDAITLMSKKRIEHLIVTNDFPGSKAVLGIVYSADIIKKMAAGKGAEDKGNG